MNAHDLERLMRGERPDSGNLPIDPKQLVENCAHHNGDCELHLRPGSPKDGTARSYLLKSGIPYRLYWCKTHGQWVSEHPILTTYTFYDGETHVVPR